MFRRCRLVWVLLGSLVLSCTCWGTSIPVGGSAWWSSDVDYSIVFSGSDDKGSASISSMTGDTDQNPGGGCDITGVCWIYFPAAGFTWLFDSRGTVDGIYADVVDGGLTAYYLLPVWKDSTFATTPGLVSGYFTGYACRQHFGCNTDSKLWDISVTGFGTVTFSGRDYGLYLYDIDVSFTGAVTIYDVVAPEPSTLAMLGSGVVGLAGLIRRKLRA